MCFPPTVNPTTSDRIPTNLEQKEVRFIGDEVKDRACCISGAKRRGVFGSFHQSTAEHIPQRLLWSKRLSGSLTRVGWAGFLTDAFEKRDPERSRTAPFSEREPWGNGVKAEYQNGVSTYRYVVSICFFLSRGMVKDVRFCWRTGTRITRSMPANKTSARRDISKPHQTPSPLHRHSRSRLISRTRRVSAIHCSQRPILPMRPNTLMRGSNETLHESALEMYTTGVPTPGTLSRPTPPPPMPPLPLGASPPRRERCTCTTPRSSSSHRSAWWRFCAPPPCWGRC